MFKSFINRFRRGGALPAATNFWDSPSGYLIWLGFLLLPLDFSKPREYVATAAATVAFLPLHFWSFQKSGPQLWLARVAEFAIGVALFPYNSFSHTFFIFAGIPGPRSKIREAIAIMGLTVAAAYLYFTWRNLPSLYFGLVSLMVLGIGSMTLIARVRRDSQTALAGKDVEIARLAKLAERERIARDLHDLLGHRLTVIAVKAELAHKIAAVDEVRAAAEMREVAQAARAALAEVRQTIGGLRSIGLREAMRAAEVMLQAAGLQVTQEWDVLPALSAAQEGALAQALLEAGTNTVRHAQASCVSIRLRWDDAEVALQVEDDGRGGEVLPGNGLAGMRERVAAVGGTLSVVDMRPGLRVTAKLPLTISA